MQIKEAQIAANKARDDAETGKKKLFKLKADYFAKVGRRRDEVDKLTQQLRQ